jgi:L-ascorbate metabolism protein UlaG (beta-lactamase superfamily)
VRRLSDGIRLGIIYSDRTPFGGMISGRIDDNIRATFRPVLELFRLFGSSRSIASSAAILRRYLGPRGEARLFFSSSRTLKRSCLYPDPRRIVPWILNVTDAETLVRRIVIPRTARGELARWIGDWSVGSRPPTGGVARSLWRELEAAGAFCETPPAPRPQGDVVLVGHASVLLRGGATEALVDPFILPQSPRYGAEQPIAISQLRPSVVFITHSHPDHFDVGTLLRLGADVRCVVPAVDRESLLSADMQARLEELGFRHVEAAPWHRSLRSGGVTVHVLPFFGEQPTDSEVLHPEVRNQGNLYVFELNGKRVALTSDGGRDHRGSVREMAAAARRRHGPVDLLLAGYRAWNMYPLSYLFSSVRRHLLFVPEGELGVRQRLMNDPADSLDTAEGWGAKVLIPYANGGAPWFWQRGLGWRPDAPSGPTSHFDPPPSVVHAAALNRSEYRGDAIRSPVQVRSLSPGEGITLQGGEVPADRPGDAAAAGLRA